MKYEIIKGSEKDFEGAPAWARIKTKSYCYEFFLEHAGIGAKYVNTSFSSLVKVSTTTAPDSDEDIIAERRPITEPVVSQQLTTEWDGEGLPPVGALCEYHANYIGSHAQYEECEIIAHFDGEGERLAAYVYTQFDGTRLVGQGTAKSFRPIRSPEDVARDAAINEMLIIEGEMQDSYQPHELIAAIYEEIAAGKIPGIKLDGAA